MEQIGSWVSRGVVMALVSYGQGEIQTQQFSSKRLAVSSPKSALQPGSGLFPDGVVRLALVRVVFGTHAKEDIIDSIVGLRHGREFPSTLAATGVDVRLLHVDVGKAE